MNRYSIFEKFPDGIDIWRGSVAGLGNAIAQMKALAEASTNEFFVFQLSTNKTVARANVPGTE